MLCLHPFLLYELIPMDSTSRIGTVPVKEKAEMQCRLSLQSRPETW